KFDFYRFLNWMYTQNEMFHPTTRANLKLNDVIHDSELKTKIAIYKTQAIKEALVKIRIKKEEAKKSEKVKSETDANSDPKKIPLTMNSPITNTGETHQKLITALKIILKDIPTEVYSSLLESVESKNYSQSLRRICTCKNHQLANQMASLLLSYKNVLKIN